MLENEKLQLNYEVLKSRFVEKEQQASLLQLHLRSLLQVSEAVNQNMPANALYQMYQNILVAQLNVQSLLLFTFDDFWNCVCSHNSFSLESTLQPEVDLVHIHDIITVLDKNDDLSKYFDTVISIKRKQVTIAYVLLGGIDKSQIESKEEKIDFIKSLTHLVVTSIDNKRLLKEQMDRQFYQKEMNNAVIAQHLLLPSDAIKNEDLNVFFNYIPHKDIGGDYYDFLKLSETEYVFCMCDVAGKGVASALIMANFQAIFKIYAEQKLPIEEFIHLLNNKTYYISNGEKHITAFIGYYNVQTKKLHYVNAGHNASILLSGKNLTELTNGTTPLGTFEELLFINVGEELIEAGDLLFNYTDGLIDVFNDTDSNFNEDMLKQFILDHASESVMDFISNLNIELQSFKQHMLFPDDVSTMCVRFR